ncbi:MAG: hypothetical protein R2715_13250 [Ilumatobacteraceae bacterium]
MLRSLTKNPVPNTMNDVASVAMNEFTFNTVTIVPFASPTTRPTATPVTAASTAFPVWCSTCRANSGATTNTDATDRSKPPAIIVIVTNDAAMSNVDC